MRPSAILGAMLSVALPFVAATPLGGSDRRYDELAKRVKGDLIVPRATISGTYTDARFTWYNAGLGACGDYDTNSDFVVALNSDQFGSGYPGPNCFVEITISYGGKTTTAQIVDECPGCPYGGLDLSEGLFEYFANPSVGVIYGTWSVNS